MVNASTSPARVRYTVHATEESSVGSSRIVLRVQTATTASSPPPNTVNVRPLASAPGVDQHAGAQRQSDEVGDADQRHDQETEQQQVLEEPSHAVSPADGTAVPGRDRPRDQDDHQHGDADDGQDRHEPDPVHGATDLSHQPIGHGAPVRRQSSPDRTSRKISSWL